MTTPPKAFLGHSSQQRQSLAPLDPVVVLERASSSVTSMGSDADPSDTFYHHFGPTTAGSRALSITSAPPELLHSRALNAIDNQSTDGVDEHASLPSTLTPLVSTTTQSLPIGADPSSSTTSTSVFSAVPPPSVYDHNPPLPLQIRASIRFDPDQHYEKLVKAKVQVVLVLTALVRLDTPPPTNASSSNAPDEPQQSPQASTETDSQSPHLQAVWIELSRTEVMSMDKVNVPRCKRKAG